MYRLLRSIGLTLALAAPGLAMKQDLILYKHAGRYAAFPSLYRAPSDELWVSFGWNTTRSHYGRAAGGRTGSEHLYSPDAGKTWRRQGRDKGFKPCPPEVSAFVLKDGTLLTLAPRMHEVLPLSKRKELEARGVAVRVWKDHISASYRVLMRRKKPGAKTWEVKYVRLPRIASIGGFGRGQVLDDGTILKPVYGRVSKADPVTRAWVLRSTDRGDSWSLVTQAYDGVHTFNEAELIQLPDGGVLGMIRAFAGSDARRPYERGFLWQVVSTDRGKTWSRPVMTPIWGYPPNLVLTKQGEVLCTYGYRRPPYGIRACFSRDGGKTWDVANEVILRWDALPNGPGPGRGGIGDLGYPRTVQLNDGSFFTVYYITLGDGVTHIEATRWTRDYVGPRNLPRGQAAIPKPDPSLPPEFIVGEVGPMRLRYGLMQSFIATEPQIEMVAIRVAKESGRPELTHTTGLSVAIRKPRGAQWWTPILARSRRLKPDEVNIGGWNAFVFDKPVKVTPGETYVLTVYNFDYVGGGPLRLRKGLSGDHSWYLNSGLGQPGGYPNGGCAPNLETDLAFKVYSRKGPLPSR